MKDSYHAIQVDYDAFEWPLTGHLSTEFMTFDEKEATAVNVVNQW